MKTLFSAASTVALIFFASFASAAEVPFDRGSRQSQFTLRTMTPRKV
jgi:hypothetical protein